MARIVHFVYGFRPQTEPFHVLHHLAIESCRRVVAPDRIMVHCAELPFGHWWDRTRPHVELRRVDEVVEVNAVAGDEASVPKRYRYAHHADVVRLDALIEHGGLYADIDSVFLRPVPEELWEAPFVIGDEGLIPDPEGVRRPSLCNALMLAQPGSSFARRWRTAMPAALGASWSGHSGTLAADLAAAHPDEVRVEPSATFFPLLHTPAELDALLGPDDVPVGDAVSLHLWAHLWWEDSRRDFSATHAGSFTPEAIARGDRGLSRLVAPYLELPADWPSARV